MIKTIEISNFKSHKDSKLELSPGVNVIVGPTDSGKSAIIQALKWLIFNRPVGDSFRSNWGGNTQVGITIDDMSVYRRKDGKDNEYGIAMTEGDPDSQEFKAIKTDVPEEIQAALNLNEINLQTQLESHFLLSRSPGDIASYFNKIAHLNKIDRGMSNINRWLKRVTTSFQSNKDRLEELKENLAEFSYLEGLETKIIRLEGISTRIDEKSLEADGISSLIRDIEKVDLDIVGVEHYVSADGLVGEILEIQDNINTRFDEICKIIELTNVIDGLNKEIKQTEFIMPMGGLVDDILAVDNKINDITLQKRRLQNMVLDLSEIDSRDEQLEIEIGRLEKLFHDNLGKGKICPLCGTKIK